MRVSWEGRGRQRPQTTIQRDGGLLLSGSPGLVPEKLQEALFI
jgi:hypothetical protein